MGVAQLPVAQKFSSIIVAHKYGQKQKILLKETLAQSKPVSYLQAWLKSCT